MRYKKLACFDFDDTLFYTPNPQEGKKIWFDKTGENWKHIGWWGKSETLDTNIFDIPLNKWVHDKYINLTNDKETFVIVATGRLEKIKGMRDNIDKIFNKNGLQFDEVHLNTGSDTLNFKLKLFEQKIETLGVEEFIIFDDRQEHLPEFEKWADNQNIKITIVDVVNKTEKTFLEKNKYNI